MVAVRGELDIATSPQVRELLSDAATDQARPLVIDLGECEFIDSTGLAALLHGAKPAQNGESHVAIVSPAGDVRRMLELTAIDRTIPVFETVDQAVAAVWPSAGRARRRPGSDSLRSLGRRASRSHGGFTVCTATKPARAAMQPVRGSSREPSPTSA